MSRNDVLQYFSRRRVERCTHDSDSDHMARRDTLFVDLCRPAMSSIIRKSSGIVQAEEVVRKWKLCTTVLL